MADPSVCEPEYVLTIDQKSHFHNKCTKGESLSFTVMSESGKEDTGIAAVQFKRTEFGSWINYLGTTAKLVSKAVFGVRGIFLDEGMSFRNIGLCFTILRSVQLLQCCSGFAPNLFIQVVNNTQLEGFLKEIGFQPVPGTGLLETVASGFKFEAFMKRFKPQEQDGFVWRDNCTILECASIVAWQGTRGWNREIYDSHRYHHSSFTKNGRSLRPKSYKMFKFPINTDGQFVDQCARGLSILGIPTFYFQDHS
jgi:hypothetical protein